MKLLCLAGLLLPALAFAQTAPPPAVPSGPENLITNGGFETFVQKDNLWDGVDAGGFLSGDRGFSDAVLENGSLGRTPMPVSVQVADLNGDGLLDLFTVDPMGYFRVYFNSGTPTEPKFTNCEMVPMFLSRFFGSATNWRWGLKAGLGDINKMGMNDLVLGDFAGEVFLIKNTGSRSAPEFRQPASLEAVTLKTSNDGHLWGNLFAPVVYDWDKDGRPDLILGEGSYSANAIHLLLNQGGGGTPKFSEEAREFLAFGDGREQLVPAVVDYNGDGQPDLLVGDRKGTINLYLSEGPWKRKTELKWKSVVTCGKIASFNGCIAPTVADLNGDGLFDLVIGKADGHIAVAYNKGTKTEPKFDTPVDLKGTDVWGPGTMRDVPGWSVDFGYMKGNMYGYGTVVSAEEDKDAEPQQGKYALKFGFEPVLNKVVKMPQFILTSTNSSTPNAFKPAKPYWDIAGPHWWPGGATEASYSTDSNMVVIRRIFPSFPFKGTGSYKLTFKVKGRSVKNGHFTFSLCGWGKRAEDKITHGERGAANAKVDAVCEETLQEGDFNPTQAWTVVSKQFRPRFNTEKELNDPEHWKGVAAPEYRAVLEVRATLAPSDGVCYFDDFEFSIAP